MIAPRGVHHLAIVVRDLPGAERFYCGTLGLPLLRRWPSADGQGERSIWVDTGDGSFLALETTADARATPPEPVEASPTPDLPPGLHLIALRIAAGERGQWEDRLVQAGFPVYHRTSFTLYVRDPEGNRVGLSHHPTPCETSGPAAPGGAPKR